jgi:hypothetical protein
MHLKTKPSIPHQKEIFGTFKKVIRWMIILYLATYKQQKKSKHSEMMKI